MKTNTQTMSEETMQRLVDRLCKEIEQHPNKDEIVALTIEQLMDD